jgi:hypothetical protein
MAVKKFTDLQGKASKSGPERFKPVNGVNRIRIIGTVVPAYKYWLKTRDDTPVPMDCLGFNRETEKFDNKVRDVVREYFPDKKCSWAYMSFVLDREDGKVKLFDHKKKLFESILDAAKKKMGDPTDEETGWDIIFSREKTGPLPYNVEYKLETFELENSPLSDEDKKAIEEAHETFGTIEDITKLPTPEDQEQFIKNYILPKEEEVDEEVEKELASEMEDDIPFAANGE